jgi:putative transposase
MQCSKESDMESPSSNLLRRGRWSATQHLYLITTNTRDRIPLFSDFRLARTVIRQLRKCDEDKACRSLAWVLMPDHLHWLIELADVDLSDLMCAFKSRSSCALYRAGADRRHIWQPSFHDRALRREEDVKVVARYIIANPIRAGLVKRAGEYPHWDCVWL